MTGHLARTWRMLKIEASLAGRPVPAVLRDCLHFRLVTGLGPRYFVVAGFARRAADPGQWRQHISGREYYRALDRLNPPLYRKFTQHKLNEKALYRTLGIATAEYLGYFHPRVGRTSAGQPLRGEGDLANLLGGMEGEKLCLKPLEGWGGTGVLVATVRVPGSGPVLTRADGSDVSLEAVIRSFAGGEGEAEFILERYVEQSGFYRQLNPSSLNTLRIWTLRTGTACEVIGAYLRVGRAGCDVDNGSRGGMMFPVDIRSGRLLPGVLKSSPHRGEYREHLDSGVIIAGEVLPDWDRICAFVREVLPLLPQTRFCGFDVAGTDSGPVLIESNVAPDKDGAAHADIPSVRLKQASRALR